MIHRLFLFALLPIAILPAAAQQPPATQSPSERSRGPADTAETLGYAADSGHRMTVSVNVAGRGPYRFVVDTGAERTVISRELAAALNLHSGGDLTLATITEISRVPSVMIPELEVGRRTFADIQAPALAEQHIGAQGMLGIDSLRSQRVMFDFLRRELTLASSFIEPEPVQPGDIVVRGRTRLGRLMVTNAFVDGQRITVIIDTGSQVTVGNGALQRRLARAGRLGQPRSLALTGVTGETIMAEYTVAREMQVGDVRIRDLPIAFSDVGLFRLLRLTERPAILLGMDALRLFDRVSIDFANRRVRLSPPSSQAETPIRMAQLAPLRPRR